MSELKRDIGNRPFLNTDVDDFELVAKTFTEVANLGKDVTVQRLALSQEICRAVNHKLIMYMWV